MNWLTKLFSGKTESITNLVSVDMHSHLLPGIDDGAASLEDSLILAQELSKLGFRKLICTPHIMGDFYKNTPEIIHEKLELLKRALIEEKIPLEVDAAAEYYIDEWFLTKCKDPKSL